MNRLCKFSNHKWTYYNLYSTNQRLRHCKRCNTLQYQPKYATGSWMNAVEYTDAGAKKYVVGSGK